MSEWSPGKGVHSMGARPWRHRYTDKPISQRPPDRPQRRSSKCVLNPALPLLKIEAIPSPHGLQIFLIEFTITVIKGFTTLWWTRLILSDTGAVIDASCRVGSRYLIYVYLKSKAVRLREESLIGYRG
jgi:hypothetical protein